MLKPWQSSSPSLACKNLDIPHQKLLFSKLISSRIMLIWNLELEGVGSDEFRIV